MAKRGDNPQNIQKRQRVSRQVRQLRVLTLKAAGHSDRDIVGLLAEQGINVSYQTVNNDWHAAITERVQLTVKEALEIIKLQMHRIDSLLSVHFDEAMEGDIIKGNFVLKLLKDQRELLGLRKPEVILYQESETVTYEEIEVTEYDEFEDRTDEELNDIVRLAAYIKDRGGEDSRESLEDTGTS